MLLLSGAVPRLLHEWQLLTRGADVMEAGVLGDESAD